MDDDVEYDLQDLSDSSTEVEVCDHNIVGSFMDGDVIYTCADGVTIRASSAVLRLRSRYFKSTLDQLSSFESELARTAAEPKRIPSDFDSNVLLRLFCLLHHQEDPDPVRVLPGDTIAYSARALRQLADLIDDCDCSQALSRVCDSLLHEFSVSFARQHMTFQDTLDLTCAAYKMNNSRYFRLFTKRLLTDFTPEPGELARYMPDRLLPALEEQSQKVWAAFRQATEHLTKGKCQIGDVQCFDGVPDWLTIRSMCKQIFEFERTWPQVRNDGIPLREVLPGMFRLQLLDRVIWCPTHKELSYDAIVSKDFETACDMVDLEAIGLCLACARNERVQADCQCQARLGFDPDLEFVRYDSFIASPETRL